MSEPRIIITGSMHTRIGKILLAELDAIAIAEKMAVEHGDVIELRAIELPECRVSIQKQRRTKGEKRRNRAERWS
jgi:hypothetical protein